MTMESLPTILFRVAGGAEMSDIQFLSIKEFDGKLVTDNGTLAVGIMGDLATLTASGGKDMYLGKARISVTASTDTNDTRCTAVLNVNGVPKEPVKIVIAGGNDGTKSVTTYDYEFELTGLKVTTTQIIKIDVTQNSNALIEGVLECFEEDTGTTPQIPSI